jgi:hypothetical protein
MTKSEFADCSDEYGRKARQMSKIGAYPDMPGVEDSPQQPGGRARFQQHQTPDGVES